MLWSPPNQQFAEIDEIAGLPELQGYGVDYSSLHQAMLRDESGTIKSLVERFSAATDTGARKELMEQLLYAWAGVRDRNPVHASYDGYGNGLQIAVLGGLNNGCADHYVINQQWRKALR